MQVGSEATTRTLEKMIPVLKNVPQTPEQAEALYKKAGKVLSKPKKAKKIGVVGISKDENVQLGLILRWVALELDWDTIPNEILPNPEALTKLIGRYQIKTQ